MTGKKDPYDGFKNDQERRRALNMRALSRAATTIVVAIASSGGTGKKRRGGWRTCCDEC